MTDEDFLAVESLVADYIANNGQLPNHDRKGAQGEWFLGLLDSLREHGYGSEFVFLSTNTKSAWAAIMSAVFYVGNRTLSKRAKDAREFIIKELRQAIALAYKDERLAKAKHEAPVREFVSDIPVQINSEPEEHEEEPTPETAPERSEKPMTAAEVNKDLADLQMDGPQGEPIFNTRWDNDE